MQPLTPALRAAFSDPENSPLLAYTDADPSEPAVRRMWARIQGGESLESAPWFQRAAFAWRLASLALVMGAALLAFWVLPASHNPAPLALADPGASGTSGALISGENLEGGRSGRTVKFEEGSHIDLAPNAKLGVVTNDGPALVFSLREGTARFSVTPGGPRKWTVDAGTVVVRVVGTVFSVERTGDATRVHVTRGIVSVSGGALPEGTVELRAGQSVTARSPLHRHASAGQAHANARESNGSSGTAHDTGGGEAEPGDTPEPGESSKSTDSRVDKAHKQGTRRAHSAAPAVPEEGRVFTLDDLEPLDEPSEVSGHRAPAPLLPADPSSDQVARALDEADRLRKLGQLEEAAAFLRDAVQGASPGDPRRALAALSYARLSTDACETAALLALTIDEMPAGLREPSLGRLVTALEACGQAERARAVAETYLLEFPEGPSSARMKGIAAP